MQLFISYAHQDYAGVVRLGEIFRAGEHDPWLDNPLLVGTLWKDELRKAIRLCQAFVYVLTPASVESEWCQWEFGEAIRLDKPIIPVLMDANTEIPDSLRPYQYADFTGDSLIGAIRLMVGLGRKSGIERYAAYISSDDVESTVDDPSGVPAQAHRAYNDYAGGSQDLPTLDIAEMVDWFFENYEDPADSVPYITPQGGYVWDAVEGPHTAWEALQENFPDANLDDIEIAVQIIEANGVNWVQKYPYRYEGDSNFD
jgi:hypothetical protein